MEKWDRIITVVSVVLAVACWLSLCMGWDAALWVTAVGSLTAVAWLSRREKKWKN